MSTYTVFVFLHLAGLVIFVFAHGASAFLAFRLRGHRAPALVIADLATSQQANVVAYVGLLLLLVGGLGAAWVGASLATLWVLATTGVFVLVIAAMGGVGARYYYGLRDRLKPGPDGRPQISPEELTPLLKTRAPEILTVVGLGGLLVMVGLMVFKPV